MKLGATTTFKRGLIFKMKEGATFKCWNLSSWVDVMGLGKVLDEFWWRWIGVDSFDHEWTPWMMRWYHVSSHVAGTKMTNFVFISRASISLLLQDYKLKFDWTQLQTLLTDFSTGLELKTIGESN